MVDIDRPDDDILAATRRQTPPDDPTAIPALEKLARETFNKLLDCRPIKDEHASIILSALSNLDRCHQAECQACRTLREHEDVDWVVKLREKDAQVAYEQERNANNTAMAEHMLGERDAEIARLNKIIDGLRGTQEK